MNSITWIDEQTNQLQDLTLKTKTLSHQFGRCLYTFNLDQQTYWLKFHQPYTHPVLETAFKKELEFYQYQNRLEAQLVLPYQIIQFDQLPQFQNIVSTGQGLVLPDTQSFFSDIAMLKDVSMIKQKILDALEVIERIHQLGWIHGDLKTEHFRSYATECRLIDFEQTQLLNMQSQMDLSATPHYMAPELFHTQPKTVQSDLYAFGIILYEWLTQKSLKAASYQDWALLHCQQLEIHLPSHLSYFYPLIDGLLQKHKRKRFIDISAVKSLLKS